MSRTMLTTKDNPFNPFKDWNKWFAFDQLKNNLVHQYFNADTCQVVDRYVPDTTTLPPALADEIVETSIDNILKTFGDLNVFEKVKEE